MTPTRWAWLTETTPSAAQFLSNYHAKPASTRALKSDRKWPYWSGTRTAACKRGEIALFDRLPHSRYCVTKPRPSSLTADVYFRTGALASRETLSFIVARRRLIIRGARISARESSAIYPMPPSRASVFGVPDERLG